jgi:hypothetical protein
VPLTVSYDAGTQRVFLRPTVLLALQRTYTAEFSPAIKALDGTALPAGVYFQFTTNSLRRVSTDYPAEDALEGPVACLGWGGTNFTGGQVLYEVYASTDSEAVARRTIPYLQRAVFTRLLPAQAWPQGQRVFWSLTSENVTTHERLDGELHSFRIFDATVPLDSLVLHAADHGSNKINVPNTQYCNNVLLPSGPSYNAAIHWNLTGLPSNARLAGVTMKLFFADVSSGQFAAAKPSAWLAQNDWAQCGIRANGLPLAELTGLLSGSVGVDALENDLTSPRLAALIEAQLRRRTFLYGTLVRTLTDVTFHSSTTADPAKAPAMVVRYYRLPPGVAR